MKITNSALILVLLAMAVANKLGGGMEPVAEDWFIQYQDEKDRGDVVSEGRSLDLDVDAAGKF